jgi:hypothetical protein
MRAAQQALYYQEYPDMRGCRGGVAVHDLLAGSRSHIRRRLRGRADTRLAGRPRASHLLSKQLAGAVLITLVAAAMSTAGSDDAWHSSGVNGNLLVAGGDHHADCGHRDSGGDTGCHR